MRDKTLIQDLTLTERRVFTISNVKGYYPAWVQNPANLIPYPISDTEHIFEIAKVEFKD